MRCLPRPALSKLLPVPVASGDPGQLRGVIASRGFAVGPAFYLQHVDIPVAEFGQGFEPESAAFDRSRDEVRARLARLAAGAAPEAREIFSAHLELLDDPQLLQDARAAIRQGKSAGFAWRGALRASAAALQATGDARIGERVDDLRDLEQQMLVALGATAVVKAEVPAGGILLARDLAPSQFIDLDASQLGGIALAAGGPTSHVAILAAAAGVPMLVASGAALLEVATGATLVLDAEQGLVNVAPTPAQSGRRAGECVGTAVQRERQRAQAQGDCHLASGERIEVFANLTGTAADAQLAVAQGAEGCGLLRTEFLFLDRASAPDENEQLRCYREVAEMLGARPLVIRTMDIGGDKPIPYLPLPPEDKPGAGPARHPHQPVAAGPARDPVPRIAQAAQCGRSGAVPHPAAHDHGSGRDSRRARVDPDARALRSNRPLPQLGAMIETPASALLAEGRSPPKWISCPSVPTISRSTRWPWIAATRSSQPRIDGLHPAVLALIARVGAAGRASRQTGRGLRRPGLGSRGRAHLAGAGCA